MEEKSITSNIKQVTVFLSGAQVERSAQVELPKGTSRLVFIGLSSEADPASVQVHGAGPFTILSVQHVLDPGTGVTISPEAKALRATITSLERKIQDERTRITVLQNEEERLLKNESFEGGTAGMSVERIRSLNDYYRERMALIRDGILAKERLVTEHTEAAQKVHLELETLLGKKPKESSKVIVEVAANAATKSTLTLRYVVRSAGWSPSYDIRVDDLSAALALTYKAQVYQSTGEDWTDVQLELASGDPRVSGVMPVLGIWRLGPGTKPPGAVLPKRPTANSTVSEVRGIVRDAATGEPLPFVGVVLLTADGVALNGATTNFDGYYALVVPPGARRIQFNMVGFAAHAQELNNSTVNAELKQTQVSLQEFQVVQYKAPLIDRDGGSSMTISSEQIRNSPQRSVQSRGARTENNQGYTGGIAANLGDASGGITHELPDVTMRHGKTHFSFRIALPYSIPSDGQGHSVAVKEHRIQSSFRYYCTPKLDPGAYLFAKLVGWDKLDLLPGPANLYFEGTFIGETFMDTEQLSDTMDISLGRDRSVMIQRERMEDISQRSFSGSKRIETIGWSIEVRNTKPATIDLVITDQIPVPVNDEVTVDLLKGDAMVIDENTGMLNWRDRIGSSAGTKHAFTYSVKAPKGMPLVLE